MTAESSTITHSPLSPATSGDGVNSPHSRRRGLPSPWAQIVRGEPEVTSAIPLSTPSSSLLPPPPPPPPLPIVVPELPTDFSDCYAMKPSSSLSLEEAQQESSDSTNNNAGRTKKPAWNKPLNGLIEVSPVMDTVSWPALSESTRPTPKSSSDSSKSTTDGSAAVSEGNIISHAPQKQDNSRASPNLSSHHPMPARQRSNKRGGIAGGGSSHSGFTRPLQPPPPPPLPPQYPLFNFPYANMVPTMLDSAVGEPHYKSNNWEATRPVGGTGSQSHLNDHSSQRNSSRRGGNFGPRPRGDGLYHNGYIGRHDQGRDRNSRGSNVRDVHLTHQMAPPHPRAFIRAPPPPGSAPFVAPQPIGSFGNPMGFDMPSPILYGPPFPPEFRGVPIVAHPPHLFIPMVDYSLSASVLNQIDYYFSDSNLVKDNYLRSNMDDQGWVPINLIANFPRVQQLTSNIQFIVESLRASKVVEVQGDKLRRREDWRKWIPAAARFPTDSGSLSPSGYTENNLATSLQKVSLVQVTTETNSSMDEMSIQVEGVPDGVSQEELLIIGDGNSNGASSSQT